MRVRRHPHDAVRLHARRLTAFTVSLSIILLLVGTVGAAAETLSVFVPDTTGEGRAFFEEVVGPAFEEENPGVEVEFQFVSWGEYLDRLTVMFTHTSPPDVIQVGGEFVGTFVLNGMIQPLDRYLADWPYLDEFPRAAILDGQVEGQQYTLPYRLDVRTLIYRKDFFEQAGLSAGSPPETWEDLLAYAKKLVRYDPEGNITRAGFHTVPAVHEALSFLFQGGARLVDETGTQAAFNSERGVEAIQFMTDLVLEHRVGLATGGPYGTGGNPVVTGHAAMENTGDWVVGQMMVFDPDNHENVGVALPTAGVEQRSVLNVNKWAMTSVTDTPDLAWKFIEFVSRPEWMGDISRVNSFMPARGTLYQEDPWASDPRWFTFYQAAELAVPMPGHAFNLAQVFTHFRDALAESLQGARPVKEALDDAARQATLRLQGM